MAPVLLLLPLEEGGNAALVVAETAAELLLDDDVEVAEVLLVLSSITNWGSFNMVTIACSSRHRNMDRGSVPGQR
jgi:hypothetical protein